MNFRFSVTATVEVRELVSPAEARDFAKELRDYAAIMPLGAGVVRIPTVEVSFEEIK